MPAFILFFLPGLNGDDSPTSSALIAGQQLMPGRSLGKGCIPPPGNFPGRATLTGATRYRANN